MPRNLNASIFAWSCVPTPETLISLSHRRSLALSVENLNTDFIPSGLRRRCSILSKAALAVAHATLRDAGMQHVPTVFSSAHGESDVTAALLRDLALEQPLSPMGFSLSVHNATSGLFSIATGNTGPSTAIAAGEHSFLMGLCEAILISAEEPNTPVLYVCSDERVPSDFLREEDEGDRSFAVAMLIGTSNSPMGCAMQVEIDSLEQNKEGRIDSSCTAASAESFIRWLNDETLSVQLSDRYSVWRCDASEPRSPLFKSPLLK